LPFSSIWYFAPVLPQAGYDSLPEFETAVDDMLTELRIHSYAIIEELRLTLAPTLNVLTGETGAGKSIIVDAVALLLGGRAPAGLVRTGDDRTVIEGVFEIRAGLQEELSPMLAAHGLEGDDLDTLVLSREIRREGRNVCRVNGRAVTRSVLSSLGRRLIDIHGQSDHLSLFRVREHVDYLDRYRGLWAQRMKLADRVATLGRVRGRLADLIRDELELSRQVDLLRFQVNEIRGAGLTEGEEERLRGERTRLANAERLLTLSSEAYAALYSTEEGTVAATDLLGQAIRALSRLQGIDASLATALRGAEELSYQLEDLVATVRGYRDLIEYNPRRLVEVEERLRLIHDLKRKYGDSVGAVLSFQRRAEEKLEQIGCSGQQIAELRSEEEALLREIGTLGVRLSESRRDAAGQLTTEVEAELEDLSMEGSRFAVSITCQEDVQGAWVNDRRLAFDDTGIDQVEFLVSPNIGEPLKPLAQVASGGETSRLMLALKAVLSQADEMPTLIFDEVDAGIGGRVGAVIGHKLWRLASQHQVFCITHLPQLAAYGDAHFRAAKSVAGQRTVTGAELLDSSERITELAAMLGAELPETRLSAEAMLAAASRAKAEDQLSPHLSKLDEE
jgi:DNA repair protein RecN (Recombination protein N)